ncbi:hypothetical protein D3C81_1176530 [compost metagenome]
MEGEHQLLAATLLLPIALDRAGDGGNPVGIDRIVLHQTDGDLRVPALPGIHAVFDRGGGGGRILRIQRQYHDAAHALGGQPIQFGGQRRFAVAHRVAYAQRRQQCLHGLRQLAGVDHQRRAFRQPHLGVLGGRTATAQRQDQAAQQGLPQQCR